ncbi:MAG: aminoacyl-tRNA deacylase [Candidatus Heimdallarchaeota archaeon]
MDNTNLKKYIEQTGVVAEILTMKGRVHSVAAASKELGVPADHFIKTVVFTSHEEKPILAIVKGTDRASSKRIGNALGISRPNLATPEEAFELTGYAVGGTPPVGIRNARVLIDPKVMDMNTVIGGGGTDHHLLKIAPKEIVKATNGKVTRVRK